MAKKLTMQELKDAVIDKTLTKAQRVKAAEEIKDRMLNPVATQDFNPDTYEPDADNIMVQLIPRKRKKPPRRLPTGGLKPKEIMEGQRVGNFESKQELYLLIADLSERLSDLEDQLNP